MVALTSPLQKVLAYRNPVSSRSRLLADVDVMIDNATVTFHTDLLNTCIYVCSPSVLTLFNDQFDLQNIERDFFAQVGLSVTFFSGILPKLNSVCKVLGSSIMSTSVYAHIVADQYAARVDCLKTYDAVSRDIIERWAYGYGDKRFFHFSLSTGSNRCRFRIARCKHSLFLQVSRRRFPRRISVSSWSQMRC